MTRDLPLYENTNGNQCMQCCMKTVLEYFDIGEFTLEELDEITARKDDEWTWTTQAAKALDQLSLDVIHYTKDALEPFLAGNTYIREHWPEDADVMIEKSDESTLIESTRYVIEHRLHTQHRAGPETIRNTLDDGGLCIALVDWRRRTHAERYQGHFLLITDHDEKGFIVHNVGPEDPQAEMHIPTDEFLRMWSATGADRDLLSIRKP